MLVTALIPDTQKRKKEAFLFPDGPPGELGGSPWFCVFDSASVCLCHHEGWDVREFTAAAAAAAATGVEFYAVDAGEVSCFGSGPWREGVIDSPPYSFAPLSPDHVRTASNAKIRVCTSFDP